MNKIDRRRRRYGKQKRGQRTCPTGKVRYPDRQRALKALQTIHNGDDRRDVTPVRAYDCPTCHGAHLTSRPA